MLSTRLRQSEKPFEWCLIYDVSDSSEGCHLIYRFPRGDALPIIEPRLRQFLFPCEHKSALPEEYSLVFTDGDGKLEFVQCQYLPMTAYVICIHSFQSCFEYLHCLLVMLTQRQLHLEESHARLTSFLGRLLEKGLDSPSANPLFTLSYKCGLEYPFVLRFLLEYYGALSSRNWITVFENMLLERSVIFYSYRFQRVTSSLLASLSLLYPFVWVHLIYPLLPSECSEYLGCPTPFVAGVHSCMVQKIKPMLSPGTVLVDLDGDTVYASDDQDIRLPNFIRRWMLRRCASTHKVILGNRETMQKNWGAITSYLCQPYLETMALLLGGYRDAVYQLQETSPLGTISEKLPPNLAPGTWLIDREAFVHSRGADCANYLQRLLRSQMTIQFIESRLDYLNSDAGMVPQDVFEDCITRMANILVPDTSKRVHLGRKTLDALNKKLGVLRIKKWSRHRMGEPAKSVEPTPPPSTSSNRPSTTGQNSSSSSSSSESLDKIFSEEFASQTHPVPRERSAEYLTERSSMVEAVFSSVREIPPEWLDLYWRNSSKSDTEVAPIQPVLTTPKSDSDSREQARRHVDDLLAALDPFCPIQSISNGSAPQPDDLATFIKQIDPLNASNDEEDLLK